MPRRTGNADWTASVNAIVRRAPKSASARDTLSAQVSLLALLGSAAPLNVLLDGLATYVETWAEGLYCSVLLVDPTGRLLRPGAAPSLPVAYVQAVDPVTIAIGQGCCGTAAARREMVIVEDVEQSDLWTAYAPTAVAHGLRACWSVPVLDDSHGLLGTLAMYYGVPRTPSTQEIDLIQFAASLAAFVIQRHRDAERLRANEARLHAAVGGTGIGLWDCDRDGKGVWFDDWCEQVDIDPCEGPDRLTRWCAQIHPDDVVRYRAEEVDCLRGAADHYAVEYRIRTRSGRWRWIHERGNVTERDGDGLPSHFVRVCFDIDEQKRMAAALRKAEDRYELAINAAQLPMWEYDVASDTVRGNVHWHRAVGYELSEEEARQRVESWLSDIHPDDALTHERVYQGPAADKTGFYETEFRIKLPNGDYKWLLDRGRVVERDATGAPLKVVGVSIDIDARKRMESTLRESEERFRSAFDFAAIGKALVAPDGRWLRVNESLCRIVGYSAEELLRIDFQAITHPDDLDADMAFIRKMLDGALSYYEMEKRYFHKDGRTIWILLSVSLVRDDGGQPLYFISQIQEITERKAAEIALRTSEERYRTLARLVHGHIFEGRLLPERNIEFTWADDAFAELFGCTRAEVNRRGWRSFVDTRDLAATEKRLAAITAGGTRDIELRIIGTTGQKRWLRMAAEPVRDPVTGAVAGLIGMAEDVTDRKALMEQMFEAVNREQRRIGSDLHDGLGQVLTGTSLLLRGYHTSTLRGDAVTPAELDHVLELVNGAIETTRSLAHGLAPGTLDCGGLTSALENLARQARRWSGLTIGFRANSDQLVMLDGATSDHLYRIAQEAITNAARHAQARCAEIVISEADGAFAVEVTDDGVGIADTATRGFGLRTMRYRAEAIGAELSIERIRPHGTRVSVRLPLRSAVTALVAEQSLVGAGVPA